MSIRPARRLPLAYAPYSKHGTRTVLLRRQTQCLVHWASQTTPLGIRTLLKAWYSHSAACLPHRKSIILGTHPYRLSLSLSLSLSLHTGFLLPCVGEKCWREKCWRKKSARPPLLSTLLLPSNPPNFLLPPPISFHYSTPVHPRGCRVLEGTVRLHGGRPPSSVGRARGF